MAMALYRHSMAWHMENLILIWHDMAYGIWHGNAHSFSWFLLLGSTHTLRSVIRLWKEWQLSGVHPAEPSAWLEACILFHWTPAGGQELYPSSRLQWTLLQCSGQWPGYSLWDCWGPLWSLLNPTQQEVCWWECRFTSWFWSSQQFNVVFLEEIWTQDWHSWTSGGIWQSDQLQRSNHAHAEARCDCEWKRDSWVETQYSILNIEL